MKVVSTFWMKAICLDQSENDQGSITVQ